MTVSRITKPGLAGMAVAVVALWTCFIGEHVIVQRANAQQAGALRDIQRLRQRIQSQPASTPAPRFPHPLRPALG